MDMNRIEVSAEPRTVLGKKVKGLRRQGIVPANVYGHADSTAIQLAAREADHTIRRAGKTSLVTINVTGGDSEAAEAAMLAHLDSAMSQRLRKIYDAPAP